MSDREKKTELIRYKELQRRKENKQMPKKIYFAPADENSMEIYQYFFDISQGKRYILVTDFVPSEIACLASSPGRISRTEVWISRDDIVDFLEYAASSNEEKNKQI